MPHTALAQVASCLVLYLKMNQIPPFYYFTYKSYLMPLFLLRKGSIYSQTFLIRGENFFLICGTRKKGKS